jgi:hypothetical protein
MTNTDTMTPVPTTPAPVVWDGMDTIDPMPSDEDWGWYMEAMYNGEM